MLFSPSDFEWWMWALFAAGCFVIWVACYIARDKSKDSRDSGVLGLMAFILGIGFTAVALIRFVSSN